MVVETQLLQEVCSKVLQAVAKTESSPITETVEIRSEKSENGAEAFLTLGVANSDYFVGVRFPMTTFEEFHATVKAATFLKLMAQVTSDSVELKVTNQYLSIKANGSYRLPLIFEGDHLLELPKLEIENPLVNFDIDVGILKSIVKYNSRRVAKKVYAQEIQSTYYIDQEGCITFSRGACINAFELEKSVKFLLSETVVKLLKLFKDSSVTFTLGVDPKGSIMQTKVQFKGSQIYINALTPNLNLESMPVGAVRASAKAKYENSIVLDREEFARALSRLMILGGEKAWTYGCFTITPQELIIEDLQKTNSEILHYQNNSYVQKDYTFTLELKELKQLVGDWTENYITLCCGTSQHMVAIKRGSVTDVLPEVIIGGAE